ncbi:hypothetical protein [uncultured Tateyamaria sp.]|uniref:hypothetical protein n=1 Tax=uncultured Tateyamaria sp. TaxID=455651 RepID=UPI00261BEACF|nr:hypothetical protein [uncultured Tateyamaria sp.]
MICFEAVMEDHRMGSAPNYTTACIVMFGVNVMMLLILAWVFWGLLAAVFLALCLNHLMDRMSVWAAARQAASIRRGKRL